MRSAGARRILLLRPVEVAIVTALAVLSLVFTFVPDLLEHAPISFERRGLIHHFWHYTLMIGSFGALFGLFVKGRWQALVELIGVILLSGALAMNLVAVLTDGEPPAGILIALRMGIILGFIIRAYAITHEPIVNEPIVRVASPQTGGG